MISLIIPAYNEENRIEKTLIHFYKYMKSTFSEFEIIVVDDGSVDNTLNILKNFKNDMPELRPLTYDKNRGKGGAVKYGVENSLGEYVFFTDADMPYPIESVGLAVNIFEKTNADAVLGKRLYVDNGAKYPWYRALISKAFSLLVRMVLKIHTTDTQCGFKGFKRDVAKSIFKKTTLSGWGFDVEIFYIAQKYNLKVKRIDVELSHNDDSRLNALKDSISIFKDLMKVRKNNKNRIYD